MNVKIEINMDNSAFEEQEELNRIFNNLGNNFYNYCDIVSSIQKYGECTQGIYDINGNRVGELVITE